MSPKHVDRYGVFLSQIFDVFIENNVEKGFKKHFFEKKRFLNIFLRPPQGKKDF
jgi:hypothetical protein